MNLVPATALRRDDADPVGTFAVQHAPRRDRAVLLVDSTVYVWPVPARPDVIIWRRGPETWR